MKYALIPLLEEVKDLVENKDEMTEEDQEIAALRLCERIYEANRSKS